MTKKKAIKTKSAPRTVQPPAVPDAKAAASARAKKAWETIRAKKAGTYVPPKPEPQPVNIAPTIALTAMPKIAGTGDVTSKAILLKMNFGLFGNTKQVDTERIDVRDEDGVVDSKIKKSRLRAQKRLLESPELEAIRSFDYQTRKHVRLISLPFEAAIDLIPFQAVQSTLAWLEQRALERSTKLVPAFLAAYPKQCEDASNELGSQHNPADYLTLEEVRDEFTFDWTFIQYGVPGQLNMISKDLYKKESEKAARQMSAAVEQVKLVLRQSMLKLVQHMSDVLQADDDGKPKRFNSSTVDNLAAFLGNFDFRNIADDGELKAAVKRASTLLQGVNVQELKDEGAVRTKVQTGMAQLATTLDRLVVKSTGRKFRLDQDAA